MPTYCVVANAQWGDNSTGTMGSVECSLDRGGTSVDCHRVWDSSNNSTLDSGAVAVTLTVVSNGSITWAVAGAQTNPLSVSSGSLGQVTNVLLLATVTEAGRYVGWTTVKAKYYSSGTLVETQTLASLVADTMSSGTNVQNTSDLSPQGSTPDKVIVTGTIQLKAVNGVINPLSAIAQVNVATQACV